MQTKSNFFGTLLLVLFLSLAAACSPKGPATPAGGPIQVGYVPVLTSAPFFVAYEKGYFAEQGLEVVLQRFRAGPEMMTPLSTGQLDVGQGATGAALFNAFYQKLDLRMVAGGPVSPGKGQADMPNGIKLARFSSEPYAIFHMKYRI